jgi:(1->4)-alpha-D-glucan 1-alpha-D-glucosylmutase
MLRRLMGGSPPDQETWKMFLILRLLGLRARRPEVFATGGYEPVAAGDDVCAFVRGGQVLVAVAVRDTPSADAVAVPAGRWHDVLTGDERDWPDSVAAAELLDRHGIAVLERADP